MEFTEALQEFLFHQGFQRIKYDFMGKGYQWKVIAA